MKWKKTSIPGVLIRTIDKHRDNRGFFFEEHRLNFLEEKIEFVQDSISISKAAVLRGMHQQIDQWQLITAISGFAIDILCDTRNLKDDIVQIEKYHLGEEIDQILLPPGVAHGFCSISEQLIMSYKSSQYYESSKERNFNWQSFNLKEYWPKGNFIISLKDQNLPILMI